MVDVATLTLRADTKDLAKAGVALDTLVAASKKANLASAQLRVQIAQTDLALKTLRASGTASKDAVSLLTNELAGLKLRLAETKTMSIQTAASIDDLKGFSTTAGHSVGNLTAQLFDVGVMMQQGQNPFVLMVQQGSQIAQVLGPMGAAGAVATLKASFMQLLNPMNLGIFAIVGLSAVVVPMIADFFKGKDAVDAYAESVKTLAKTTEEYQAAAEASVKPIMDAIVAYGQLAGAAVAAQQAQEAAARNEALAALQTNVQLLSNTFGGLYQEQMRVLGSVVTLVPAVQELKREYNFTEAAASQFINKLRDLETAQGPVEAAAAAQELRNWLEAAYGSVDKMPGPMREFYNSLNDSVLASASLQGAMDLADGILANLKDTAEALKNELYDASQADLAFVFASAFPNAYTLLGLARSINAEMRQAASFKSAQTSQLASQYAQYGAGRTAFDKAAREGSDLYTPFDYPKVEDFGGKPPPGRPMDLGVPEAKRGGGGGSRSNAASEAEKEAKAIEKVIENLRSEAAMVGQTAEAKRLHQELQRAGVTIYSEEGQQIAQLVEELTQLEAKQKLVSETLKGIESAAEGFFTGVLSGAQDLKSAIGDVLKQLGDLFLNQAFKMLWGGASAGGSGEGIGGWLAGLFDAGGHIPAGAVGVVAEKRPEFVNGKLVTTPTLVPGPANVTGGSSTANILRKAAGASPSYGGGYSDRVASREMSPPRVTVQPPPVIVLDDPRKIDAWSRSPEGERSAARQQRRLSNG